MSLKFWVAVSGSFLDCSDIVIFKQKSAFVHIDTPLVCVVDAKVIDPALHVLFYDLSIERDIQSIYILVGKWSVNSLNGE